MLEEIPAFVDFDTSDIVVTLEIPAISDDYTVSGFCCYDSAGPGFVSYL